MGSGSREWGVGSGWGIVVARMCVMCGLKGCAWGQRWRGGGGGEGGRGG
jgi:hypothetical protein